MGGGPVGRFTETGDATATFEYLDGYAGTPVSLSLRPGSPHSPDAPFNYLDNLLPDNLDTRKRLAQINHTAPDVFSLLAVLGEDVAGAVTLSEDEQIHERTPVEPRHATDDDIAFWVSTLKHDPTAPPPEWMHTRWSLAGQQAKFSLADIAGRWYWSTYETPSTHIFKPEWEQHRKAERAEYVCLQLAGEAGLPATDATIQSFVGQSALAVKRWDRGGPFGRLHAEDLTQALGIPGKDKYEVPTDAIVNLLRPLNLEWPFIEQMLFNMAIGNVDAHAKNYTLLLSGTDAVLAPIYDTVPIFLWPQYPQTPVVFLNEPRAGWSVDSETDWLMFAHQCGLDPHRMMETMRATFRFVVERLPDAFAGEGFEPADKDLAARFVDTHLRRFVPKPVPTRHPLAVADEQLRPGTRFTSDPASAKDRDRWPEPNLDQGRGLSL